MNISANRMANFTARLVNYFLLRIQIGPACNIILNPNITHLVIHAHDVTVPSNFTEVFENTCRGKGLAYRSQIISSSFWICKYTFYVFRFIFHLRSVKGQNYCDLYIVTILFSRQKSQNLWKYIFEMLYKLYVSHFSQKLGFFLIVAEIQEA